MLYNIKRGKDALNVTEVVKTNVELPEDLTLEVDDYGISYIQLQAVNEHGTGAYSNSIQVVNIRPAKELEMMFGENTLTLKPTEDIPEANGFNVFSSDNNTTWNKEAHLTVHNFNHNIVKGTEKPHYKYQGIYKEFNKEVSHGDYSPILSYEAKELNNIVMGLHEETEDTLTYIYAGADDATIVRLASTPDLGIKNKFDLTTKLVTITKPKTSVFFYAVASRGFSIINSNKIEFSAFATIRNVKVKAEKEQVTISWNLPYNPTYTGLDIVVLCPDEFTEIKSSNITNGIMEYVILKDKLPTDYKTGIYTVNIITKYPATTLEPVVIHFVYKEAGVSPEITESSFFPSIDDNPKLSLSAVIKNLTNESDVALINTIWYQLEPIVNASITNIHITRTDSMGNTVLKDLLAFINTEISVFEISFTTNILDKLKTITIFDYITAEPIDVYLDFDELRAEAAKHYLTGYTEDMASKLKSGIYMLAYDKLIIDNVNKEVYLSDPITNEKLYKFTVTQELVDLALAIIDKLPNGFTTFMYFWFIKIVNEYIQILSYPEVMPEYVEILPSFGAYTYSTVAEYPNGMSTPTVVEFLNTVKAPTIKTSTVTITETNAHIEWEETNLPEYPATEFEIEITYPDNTKTVTSIAAGIYAANISNSYTLSGKYVFRVRAGTGTIDVFSHWSIPFEHDYVSTFKLELEPRGDTIRIMWGSAGPTTTTKYKVEYDNVVHDNIAANVYYKDIVYTQSVLTPTRYVAKVTATLADGSTNTIEMTRDIVAIVNKHGPEIVITIPTGYKSYQVGLTTPSGGGGGGSTYDYTGDGGGGSRIGHVKINSTTICSYTAGKVGSSTYGGDGGGGSYGGGYDLHNNITSLPGIITTTMSNIGSIDGGIGGLGDNGNGGNGGNGAILKGNIVVMSTSATVVHYLEDVAAGGRKANGMGYVEDGQPGSSASTMVVLERTPLVKPVITLNAVNGSVNIAAGNDYPDVIYDYYRNDEIMVANRPEKNMASNIVTTEGGRFKVVAKRSGCADIVSDDIVHNTIYAVILDSSKGVITQESSIVEVAIPLLHEPSLRGYTKYFIALVIADINMSAVMVDLEFANIGYVNSIASANGTRIINIDAVISGLPNYSQMVKHLNTHSHGADNKIQKIRIDAYKDAPCIIEVYLGTDW